MPPSHLALALGVGPLDWPARPGVQVLLVLMLMHRSVLLLLLVLQQLRQVALHGVHCRRRRHRQTPQSGTVSLQPPHRLQCLHLVGLLLPPWQCTILAGSQNP